MISNRGFEVLDGRPVARSSRGTLAGLGRRTDGDVHEVHDVDALVLIRSRRGGSRSVVSGGDLVDTRVRGGQRGDDDDDGQVGLEGPCCSTSGVCGSGPSEASTMRTTPSTMDRRVNLAAEVGVAGVSITLMVTPSTIGACAAGPR